MTFVFCFYLEKECTDILLNQKRLTFLTFGTLGLGASRHCPGCPGCSCIYGPGWI